MKTTRDKFKFLMDTLNRWKISTVDREKNAGAFSFLEKGIYVRDIVVSPNYRTAMPGLKTFLATDVLEIYYTNSKSKITYKDIEAYLSGEKVKKYGFYFGEMEQCFEEEANLVAFLKNSHIMKESIGFCGDVESCDKWLPYILMDKIRETAWKKLKQYNALCEKECCDMCERKEQLYFQFAQAVALFEIFFDECVSLPLDRYFQVGEEKLRELEQETEQLQEQGKQLSGDYEQIEELRKSLNRLRDNKIAELEEATHSIIAFKLLEAEFAVHLCALLNLLMVFEAVNVCDADYRKDSQIGFQLREELYDLVQKNFSVFLDRNKNRKKHFLRVNEHLEEVLVRYADGDYNVVGVTVEFLEELEKPLKQRNGEKLRELCCMLAYPVYRELGGK